MNEKTYQTELSFDFTKIDHGDWKAHANRSTIFDGGESVRIADYLFNKVKVDKRNIATGGASDYDFVSHYPRPNLPDAYGEVQWTAILLIHAIADISPRKNILALSGGADRFRLKPFQEIYGSKITFLNNKKLALYEKFQYETTPLDYSVVTMQDIEEDIESKFDMIIGWSLDFENPFVPIDLYIDRLEEKGVLIIQNSSDSMFLYNNHTQATPVWEYHDDIKFRNDCNVYHIPLFYGITIVVKNKI